MKVMSLRSLSLVLGSVLLVASAAAASDRLQELADADHWKEVRALAEPMLQTNPKDDRALFFLGRYKEVAGDYDGALALAQKALAIDPKNPDYHCLLSFIYGRQVLRAGIFRKIGLARRVRKEAERALELKGDHVEAHIILIEFFRQAPGIIGGNKAKARALAEELVRFDPVRGYIAQANFAHEERLESRVEGLYKKAVEADPRSYIALITLARSYGYGGQRNFALIEKYAREAMALDPGRVAAYDLIAQNLARLERWPDLEDLLVQAEKNVPDNLSPYIQAGRIVLQQGKDFERAERYFRKFLTQEPEPVFTSRGSTSSYAQTYWRLGQTLEKMNRKAEAVDALRTALKLDPNLDGAKKDLKRLR
ncbi:MAG: tetratricopeptide repeat protein [Candidatus Aminicenantes bacterium]|nr:tetratricopeptide repeat protein [Candidatus Aminicenantes bacterium]